MADEDELFRGLQALVADAFPKTCPTCGRVYASVDDYLRKTDKLSHSSGLKASVDDDDGAIIEVYRNCVCGSTLMDVFSDRRESTDSGQQRRQRFGRVLEVLAGKGVEPQLARTELLRLLRGEASAVLAPYIKPRTES